MPNRADVIPASLLSCEELSIADRREAEPVPGYRVSSPSELAPLRPCDPEPPWRVPYRPNPRRSRLVVAAQEPLPAFQPLRGDRTAHKHSPENPERPCRHF